MGAVGIGHYQRVFVVLVLEEIVHAFLLHQAADEIEIRFAILHAINLGLVAAIERFFEIAEAVIAKDFFNDIRNRLVLKDATVGGAREEP